MSIGSRVDKNWVIWNLADKHSTLNSIYYKFFKEKYLIKKWSGQSVGISGNETFIACCRWYGKERKNICAVQYLKKQNCNFIASLKKELFLHVTRELSF